MKEFSEQNVTKGRVFKKNVFVLDSKSSVEKFTPNFPIVKNLQSVRTHVIKAPFTLIPAGSNKRA